MQTGYICLHRAIQENKFYFSERFTKTSAWIDLLLLARHKAGVIYLKGIEINLNRGDVAYSMLSLAERWQWDRKTVKQYLTQLQAEGMIRVKHSRTTTTIISILKYDIYQRPEGIRKNTDIGITTNADIGKEANNPINIAQKESTPKPTDIGIRVGTDNGLDNETDINKKGEKGKTRATRAGKVNVDEHTDLTDNKRLNLKAEPAPTVGVRELLSYFAQCHERHTGAPYLINYGKDSAIFKAMLPVYGPDKMMELINVFFQSKDDFVLRAGFTVGVLRGQINKLAVSLAPKARPAIGATAAMEYYSQSKGITAL
jgi:hypothetical protein